jgi:hypothetical protein
VLLLLPGIESQVRHKFVAACVERLVSRERGIRVLFFGVAVYMLEVYVQLE